MANNSLARQLRAAHDRGYEAGVWAGMHLGFDIAAIGINHKLHKGEQSIRVVEDYCNELIREMVDVNDPELTRHNLLKALRQFRGPDYELGWGKNDRT